MKIHVIPICDVNERQRMRLKKLGDVKFFKKTISRDPDFLKKCIGADILMMTPRPPIDVVPYLKKCKFISVLATGFDGINIKLAKEKGILVGNVPAYATHSVVEHIFALILGLSRNIKSSEKIVRNGKWNTELMVVSMGLHGRTLGVFGFGKIGQMVADIAKTFGMRVIAYTKNVKNVASDIDFVSFDKFLADSDVIVLASPLNEETYHKFGEKEFAAMKKQPIFINTARGAIVDEKALIKALKNKWIFGAGLDVFEKEPVERSPFAKFDNVILSPHVAWGSDTAASNLVDVAIDNIEVFLNGTPKNIVNF